MLIINKPLSEHIKDVAHEVSKISNTRKMYNLRKQQFHAPTESVDISTLWFKAARIEYIETLLTELWGEGGANLVAHSYEKLLDYMNRAVMLCF